MIERIILMIFVSMSLLAEIRDCSEDDGYLPFGKVTSIFLKQYDDNNYSSRPDRVRNGSILELTGRCDGDWYEFKDGDETKWVNTSNKKDFSFFQKQAAIQESIEQLDPSKPDCPPENDGNLFHEYNSTYGRSVWNSMYGARGCLRGRCTTCGQGSGSIGACYTCVTLGLNAAKKCNGGQNPVYGSALNQSYHAKNFALNFSSRDIRRTGYKKVCHRGASRFQGKILDCKKVAQEAPPYSIIVWDHCSSSVGHIAIKKSKSEYASDFVGSLSANCGPRNIVAVLIPVGCQ